MELLYRKLYQLYKESLYNLNIGYSLNECPISEIWELMELLLYIESGYASEDDINLIADHYAVNSALLRN